MDAPLLARALAYAARAHEGQRRKAGRDPYVVHPLRVVGRLHAWGAADAETLAAAALHDVVEDTDAQPAEVAEAFGPHVAALVEALTHPPGLPPRERTRAILDALARAPLEALLVKLADRVDNLHEMPGWRPTSRLGYLGESEEIGDLAERRLARGDGDPATRAALARALREFRETVAARRAEAERDLAAQRGRARGRRGAA